ncbi:hypothetical protein H6F86_12160 [Phormidium sp. FACHB-592]|uniref:DUF4142 domain-containing protein n=1 Tax=Stenomitos frigidus AS-A4 TaxID=2933935 RepID=A0ABV0KS15_9CYAN|nr:hypothetical protein [Phormidium sp. FACHB-592]MBD2074628.1 hypothetical protein [Phormidium sp. FACHB-592]
MNSNELASLVFGLAVVSLSPDAQAQAASTNTTLAVVNAECVGAAVQNNAKALAQEIARLGVERVLLEVRFTQDHPGVEWLKQRQQGLQACFAQRQPKDQDLLDATTVSVMASQLAESESLYTVNQSQYLDDHPVQQQLRAEMAALRQHLSTLLSP